MAGKSVALNFGGSSVWTPYKELNYAVEAVLINKDVEAVPDFVAALRRHKPDFSSLLENPSKSALHREVVSKASKDGIAVAGRTAPHVLPQAVVDEALIISDMFDLNELVSLELLLAGEQQQPLFPDLTRGLVAVLLYYDGRRALVNALRTLVQVTEGRTWTLGLNTDIVATVTKYTDGLKEEDGVFMKVLDALGRLDIAKELDVLQKNRALGALRYRKQVVDMIQETHQSLAEIIFCWACQRPLSKEEALRIFKHLASSGNTEGSGTLDSVTLTLLMASLYVMDVSILQSCEDTSPEIAKLPLVCSPDLLVALHKQLSSETVAWRLDGMKSVLMFAWALVLRTFLQFPLISFDHEFAACLEEDDKIMDAAIEAKAFQMLQNLVVSSEMFHKEEFFLKRVHGLITDFIIMMPLKVKELRNQGDEAARIINTYIKDGLTPPTGYPQHFEQFLGLISEVYSKDPLKLQLAQDYWCPTEVTADVSHITKPPQRQIALFKFLRLSGDLLTPTQFVPYVSILHSLSQSPKCAHYCFNLLKNNGLGTQLNLVSWDHFFSSLHSYYDSLRQESSVGLEAQHLYRPAAKTISPLEIRGLIAVLQLIETVVRHDEVARMTLCEHPQHSAITLLVSLAACGVPPELKSAFLNTLSAFAVSPDVAFRVWQVLEAAQLLPLRQGVTATYAPGLHTELEEVESRNEEYPVTRSMLKLISALVDHPLPSGFSANLLRSGLDPYLDFVRESVFLKFHLRGYAHENEKWEVARLCLEIVEKLLSKYGPVADESSDLQPLENVSGTQGAFNILAHLLQSGSFLQLILLVLDEGTKELEAQTVFRGKHSFEEATLLCLRILQQTLMQQDYFLQQVRNSNAALIVTSLDQLLMAANPSTGRPDYVLVISQYIVHNGAIPKHALAASRILLLLSQNGKMTEHLATVYTFDRKTGLDLIQGFAETLDVEGDADPRSGSERDWTPREVRTAACQSVLRMLLNCLEHTSPNVGHFLLGFDIKHPISKTTLQEPGVLGSPRTCLHAILSFLDQSIESKGRYGPPSAIELGYKLVYVLCATPMTSEPVMRYLRTTRDFFYDHLQRQPRSLTGDENTDTKILLQQSWVLRCVALELRFTAAQNQRSHVQRLVTVLLEDNPEVLSCPVENAGELGSGSFHSSLPSRSSAVQTFVGPVRRKLLKLLDVMDFSHRTPSKPAWEFFDAAELEKALRECEYQEPGGPLLLDIPSLYRRLSEEAASAKGPTVFGQKSLVAQEIKSVMQNVLERNQARQAMFAKKQAFLAWRQVTEVLVTTCPLDILGGETKVQVLLELAQELLRRILEERSLAEVVAPTSGVLLMLMAALHHSLLLLLPDSCSTGTSNLLRMLSVASYSSSLLAILKSLLECLIRTGSGLQRVRSNYYTSLLNLLRLVRNPTDSRSDMEGERVLLDSRSDTERLRQNHMEMVSSYGEQLMEVVCRDVCSGHEVTQMLALATLDVILSLDVRQHWLSYLSRKGYLRHLIDSIMNNDEEIKNFLARGSGDEAVRSLYVLESKMALFARLASSRKGAQALLENSLVANLARCEAIDFHPSRLQGIPMHTQAMQWLKPSVGKSYQQTFVPTLQLLLAVTAALGPKHREAHIQICLFIAAHAEVFSSILLPRHLQDLDVAASEELALVTSLLSQLSMLDDNENDPVLFEQRGRLRLLQNQMLGLLPWLTVTRSGVDLREKILLLRIASGVLTFYCNLCTISSSADRKSCRILFSPTISYDALYRPADAGQVSSNPPSLRILVQIALAYTADVQRCVSAHTALMRRIENLADLGTSELAELLPPDVDQKTLTSMPSSQLRDAARKHILSEASLRQEELTFLMNLIEQALFLLWRHLEYFLLQCVPQGATTIRQGFAVEERGFHSGAGVQSREPEASKGAVVSREEVEALKSDVRGVLNESFFREVQAKEQYIPGRATSAADPKFFEALVRRLKRLATLNTV
ncbi:nuclear pore complex protein Nup205-like [Ornithodoros turicata]|uniref:nuclear pore complex protein Nup205-like n=1 Tax=Ornithodoros turicata TaxID=34597 RepID=UPI003138C7A1